MKKIIIEDSYDIAKIMYDKISDGCNEVMFIGLYDDIIEVTKELLCYADTMVYDIEIEAPEMAGYDNEYYLTLDRDMEVWCEKAYQEEHDSYLYSETNYVLIADDCNSAILKEIECNELYEVSYDFEDESDECDGDCENCKFAEHSNLEKPDDEIGRQLKGDDTHEVVTRVATDEDGKLRGFEKSWETKEDGLTYKSTYTYYSNNEDMLKNMLENFDIKF